MILALPVLILATLAWAEEKPAPAQQVLIETATYTLNFTLNGRPYFGHGHAFHCEALPGYLVSAAHIFRELHPDQVYDAEPGRGEHLSVKVAYLDHEHDLAILRIVRGRPGWSIPLGGDPKCPADCRMVHGPDGDPRMDNPCVVSGHDRTRTKFFLTQRPYDGLSGAIGIQDGKAVFIAQRRGLGAEENPGIQGVGGEMIRKFVEAFKASEAHHEKDEKTQARTDR